MPLPLAPLIVAGAGLLGQGISNAGSAAQNRRNRAFQWDMYAAQRRDALADWAMQNEYNSPKAQMARLREAQLNPNLVYGNGVDGNASSMPRSADAPNFNPVAPQWDFATPISQGIAAYYDIQLKEAQIDNLKAANTVQQQDALLKAAQVIATGASTEKTKADTAETIFDTQLKNQLKDMSVEAAKLSLRKTEADIKVTLDANERAAAMQAPTIQKAVEEILTMRMNRTKIPIEKELMRQQIENLKKDASIKQLDIDLKRVGVQPTDALWQRVIARLLNLDNVQKLDFTKPPKNAPTSMRWFRNEYNQQQKK